jgi:DNA-binding NtrC family response regulator
LSRNHARLLCARGQWILEDLGSKNGTFVDGARIGRHALPAGGIFDAGRTIFCLAPRLPGPVGATHQGGDPARELPVGLASLLPQIQAQGEAFLRIARSPIPLLLRGETGTGKELVARAAHGLSGREGPFVAVHGAGVTPSLLANPRGHEGGGEPGAEPGASGLLRAAEGGTLFLDEVADLSPPAQASLLHALEGREAPPGQRDARIIAASNRGLDAEVSEGRFRADLYARLAGYTHGLLPLRERAVDLGSMIAYTLQGCPRPPAPAAVTFDIEAGRALVRYPWPLNGRELRRCIEAALVLSPGGAVSLAQLPAALALPAPEEPPPSQQDQEQLRAALVAALQGSRGNVAEVARAFGKGPTQIHRWMKRFGLTPASFRA